MDSLVDHPERGVPAGPATRFPEILSLPGVHRAGVEQDDVARLQRHARLVQLVPDVFDLQAHPVRAVMEIQADPLPEAPVDRDLVDGPGGFSRAGGVKMPGGVHMGPAVGRAFHFVVRVRQAEREIFRLDPHLVVFLGSVLVVEALDFHVHERAGVAFQGDAEVEHPHEFTPPKTVSLPGLFPKGDRSSWVRSPPYFHPRPAGQTMGQRDFGLTFARSMSFGASSRHLTQTSSRSRVLSSRFSMRIRPSTIVVSTLSPLAV